MQRRTILLGATCWSIGYLLRGDDEAMVIGGEGCLGNEFFSSFALQQDWRPAELPGPLAELADLVETRKMVSGAGDVFRMAPAFYRSTEALAQKFIMMADIMAVEPSSSGWTVTYNHAGGVTRCEAATIIDTTARGWLHRPEDRANLTGRFLQAVLVGPGELKAVDDCRVYPGAAADERIVAVPVGVAADWTTVRCEWQQAIEPLLAANPEWRVGSIGRETVYHCRQADYQLEPGYFRHISVACGGPLTAALAGYLSK